MTARMRPHRKVVLLTGFVVLLGAASTAVAQLPDTPPPPPPLPPPPPSPSPPSPQAYASIMDFIDSRKQTDMKLIYLAVQTAGLSGMWSNTSLQITAFLPTDKAFNNMAIALGHSDALGLALSTTGDVLTKLASYHLMNGAARWRSLMPTTGVSTTMADTVLGNGTYQRLKVVLSPTSATIVGTTSSANITEIDIPAGSGYVNVIDGVLQYWYNTVDEALAAQPSLTTFRTMVQTKNWTGQVSSPVYTLFAPADNAFTLAYQDTGVDLSNLLDTLRYHTISKIADLTSKVQYITLLAKYLYVSNNGGSNVTVSNFEVDGSVANVVYTVPVGMGPNVSIVVLDQVLLPTYTSVWKALISNSFFSNISAAFQTNNAITSQFQAGSSQMTVFAPTNTGVANYVSKYHAGYTSLVGSVSSDQLNQILKLHVVPARNLSYAALVDTGKQTLDTMYNSQSLTTTPSVVAGVVSVQVDSAYVSCTVTNTYPVNFGSAYVHSIGCVLLATDPNAPGSPGGASMAAPSSLVLLASAAALISGRLLRWP